MPAQASASVRALRARAVATRNVAPAPALVVAVAPSLVVHQRDRASWRQREVRSHEDEVNAKRTCKLRAILAACTSVRVVAAKGVRSKLVSHAQVPACWRVEEKSAAGDPM